MAQLSLKYMQTVRQFVYNAPQSSELSQSEFLERPLPVRFAPLRFTNTNQVVMGDIEHMLEGHIRSLYSVEYLSGIKRFFLYLFPRMRIYEYVIQICRCAEEHYLDNNQFISEKIEKLNCLVDSYDRINYELSEGEAVLEDYRPLSSITLSEIQQWLLETGPILKKFQKLAKIMREIGLMLKIPRVTDRFPLRFMLNYVFVLVSSRIELLEQLELCLQKLSQLSTVTSATDKRSVSETNNLQTTTDKCNQDDGEKKEETADDGEKI